MIFNKKLKLFSQIYTYLNNDSTNFLLKILKKRKKYLFINISTGLADALLELMTISMYYFIIRILTSENINELNFENFAFIKNFGFLVNYLSSLNFRTIFIVCIIFTLCIQLAQVFTRYVNFISSKYIEAAYVSIITKNIYSYIFSLNYKFSSKYKMGDLAEYINGSPILIRDYIFTLNLILVGILTSFVYIYFLIRLSFWNIIVLSIVILSSNKIRGLILPKINLLSAKVLSITVDLSENIIEKFQALRLIYSNGLNEFVINDLNKKTNNLENAIKTLSRKAFIFPSLIGLTPAILLAFISIIYSFFSDQNTLLSTMAILLLSLQRLVNRLTGIAKSLSNIAEYEPKLNRVIALFKEKDFEFRRLGGKIIKLPIKQITFSRINFKYSSSARFGLKDINFSMKTGEITALVGLSGSGKSSLLDLLVGLFEANSGDIFIDGNKLKDINLGQWQREISVVSQDNFLLNDSIISNIKFGISNVSFKDIKKACIDSGAHEFIESLPNSYNTIIGERGFKLSGGERQRLSIARAFLKKSSLLILDEATSALDSKNEEFIKQNIEKLKSNKIILIVAHRLSTIKEAENIIVLNRGKIVERGNHDSLLEQKKLYRKLWGIQSKN